MTIVKEGKLDTLPLLNTILTVFQLSLDHTL